MEFKEGNLGGGINTSPTPETDAISHAAKDFKAENPQIIELSQKREIFYKIVNSGISGALVFLGACTAGQVDYKTILTAAVAAAIVAISQFKDYWKKEEEEYCTRLGSFIF